MPFGSKNIDANSSVCTLALAEFKYKVKAGQNKDNRASLSGSPSSSSTLLEKADIRLGQENHHQFE